MDRHNNPHAHHSRLAASGDDRLLPPDTGCVESVSPLENAKVVYNSDLSLRVRHVPRSKPKRHNIRLSVTLDEGEYAVLTPLRVELDLSSNRLIRRAVSEFAPWHGQCNAADLPRRHSQPESRGSRRARGSHGA